MTISASVRAPICDVAIVGGGPAGVATALALVHRRPGTRIAIVAGAARGRRGSAEMLPWDTLRSLETLGLDRAFLASVPQPARGAETVWGADSLAPFEANAPIGPAGWHIDRPRFDATLIGEARTAGIDFRPAASLLLARYDGHRWQLDVGYAEGIVEKLTAGFIVDATGRAAHLATDTGATRLADDRLVAVSVVYRLPAAHPLRDSAALVESRRDGWWRSALQPDGRLVATCFTDADLAQNQRLTEPEGWRIALSLAPRTRARTAHGVADDAPVLRPAETTLLDRLAGPAWLAVGDAAATLDPLLSHGTAEALRHSLLAAEAIADHLGGQASALPRYETAMRRSYEAHLARKHTTYARERRWPESLFWHRRHQLFDTADLSAIAV